MIDDAPGDSDYGIIRVVVNFVPVFVSIGICVNNRHKYRYNHFVF